MLTENPGRAIASETIIKDVDYFKRAKSNLFDEAIHKVYLRHLDGQGTEQMKVELKKV
jgi:hypothetical protein